MDWELYERYRSSVLLVGLIVVSSLLLGFRRTSAVQSFRSFLVRFTLPPQRFLSQTKFAQGITESHQVEAVPESVRTDVQLADNAFLAETRRKLQVLEQENAQLHRLLELRDDRWPQGIVAHVVGRDPQRWFQEIVLDKGREEGISPDAAVLAVSHDREALVGRIIEVSAHVSKVMLLQDSLCSVAATVVGVEGEDGVVEGTNSHDLWLKFLSRGSQVKIGQEVVTSGLGRAFPMGIPIGWIEEIEPDPRQLFLQARLRPAAASRHLGVVLVLSQ
jgi:rod shape-determining protein MreC